MKPAAEVIAWYQVHWRELGAGAHRAEFGWLANLTTGANFVVPDDICRFKPDYIDLTPDETNQIASGESDGWLVIIAHQIMWHTRLGQIPSDVDLTEYGPLIVEKLSAATNVNAIGEGCIALSLLNETPPQATMGALGQWVDDNWPPEPETYHAHVVIAIAYALANAL